MDSKSFHKQKLYALIVAAIGAVSYILPWYSVPVLGQSYTVNGMHGGAILGFLGFLAAGACVFLDEDKLSVFSEKFKLYAAIAFGAGGTIALITFLRATEFSTFGIWLAIAAGVAGVFLVAYMKPDQLDKISNRFNNTTSNNTGTTNLP